jgi:glycosyltransferase involved in cell wall biosynthesis
MSKCKSVLHVVEPGCDGVFRYAETLVVNQLRAGMDVTLAYSSVRGSDRLKILTKSVEQAGGNTLDLRVNSSPQVEDGPAFAKLLGLIRRQRPDVIHCHSSKAGILGRAAGSVLGVPVVYTPNAYYGMGKKGGLRTVLFNTLERFFGGFGHTINVSEDEAAFARECLGVKPSRQRVIQNSVDTDVFKPASLEDRARWRLAKRLPANAIVIGTLGRLSYQKDPLTLYRAFEIVARKNADVYLAHLGTGELAKECKAWSEGTGLAGRIFRIDYSPEPAEFYRGLDCFILSSRYEGLSFAVLEALATDLPIVLTDVPGNRDFLGIGLSHIWSAPAADPKSLALAMEAGFVDLARNRPSNHRAVAIERFSQEICLGKILDVYRKATCSRRDQL